jgi:predicted site-specific integrase-resolvase
MPDKYTRKKGWNVPEQKYKMCGYLKMRYHSGMNKIGSMLAQARRSVLAMFASSHAMKYDRYIVCHFDKAKALLIRYFES